MPRFRSEKNLNGYHLGARSIQSKFPEILVQNSKDRCGSTRTEFRENWSTFWGGPLFPVGPVGNFGWMDCALRKVVPNLFSPRSPGAPPSLHETIPISLMRGIVRWWNQGRCRGGPPLLFIGQTEAPRAEKIFLTPPPPPLISGSGWPGPSRIWRSGSATVADQYSAALTSIVLTQLTLLPYQRNYSHKK